MRFFYIIQFQHSNILFTPAAPQHTKVVKGVPAEVGIKEPQFTLLRRMAPVVTEGTRFNGQVIM